ncbi:hypothetical protein CWI38_1149p0020 [Hamiltosporidium tvaerminnensis]|uniref:Tc1-like transposase DDE domain-containing protein n=1 Tax=Hamiltosporidium tvaerminnensis TaxID=1176355 RepID=A0A4Q9LSV7_9MICR|nr:hypothetical protein CWI38_1149p0020 [Hamiltosporidium tvaerminnensis]
MSEIASMYRINYQTVNSIKRVSDRRSKLTLEIKESLQTYVDLECTKTLTIDRAPETPERRNKLSTIDLRTNYATCFRELEVDNDDKNFVFLDESAYLSVTEARSRNISVVAVMNKYGMIYHKIHERAVNDEDLKLSIKEINESCQPQGILTPIFVIDNARIHQYRGLNDDEKLLRGARTELQLRISICEKFNEKEEHCGSFCRKKLGYLQKAEVGQVILK